MVGIWGATENMTDAGERLRSSGATEVVISLAEAVLQLAKFSVSITDEMVPGTIPDNEKDRLAELTRLHLLDGASEEVFDRITKKLARVFDVPIALITLIDRDRQWFKSHIGLPDDIARTRQTSRELSICGHVVGNNELLVVEDLARDRRFANNPLLKERGLRFYAGAPLRSNKLPIGSLCLLDIKPRRMTDRDKRLLEAMADDVMEEIESRATEPKGPERGPDKHALRELEVFLSRLSVVVCWGCRRMFPARGQRAEARGQRAEGGGQRAESREQRAENRRSNPNGCQ